MAERLTPRTPDLEVRGSSLARRVVSLDKELYSANCLSLPGAQLFEGQLALNPGLKLTRVSFSRVQKHLLG